MAKNANQKLKLLYLIKILEERTDPVHTLTMPQIVSALKKHGVIAERKSLYDDLEALKQFGLDIQYTKTKTYNYFLAGRKYSLPELRLLVDAVQSSRFITSKKSLELIKKLESLGSAFQAKQLHRQVYVSNRVKTMNESVYHNIDRIQEAIAQNRQIRFRYIEWVITPAKPAGSEQAPLHPERKLRKNGLPYSISPWALYWDHENYYAIAYYPKRKGISHFRVDKMESIEMLEYEREGSETFAGFDTALYANRLFGMFGGEEEEVELQFANRLIGVVIDRFGKDIGIHKAGESHFAIKVRATISPTFWAWLFTFGEEVKILSPQSAVKAYKRSLRRAMKPY